MNSLIRWMLTLAAGMAVVQWCGTASAQPVYGDFDTEDLGFSPGGTEEVVVLTIHADGSCLSTSESVESRTMAERQARMLARYRAVAESEGTEPPDAAQPATNGVAEPKPFTDAELSNSIMANLDERAGDQAEDSGQKISLAVNKDTVTTRTTQSFSSLEEMLKDSESLWARGGVMFENARFETDTNGHLQVTLTPQKGMERYLKQTRAAMKLSGTKSELKLVFPGQVIASGLPAFQTNATWLAMDGKQEASLDAVAKLYAAPIVITAEAGGLKLDQPLESRKLQRERGRSGAVDNDQPVTDAGPGFVAEAQSLTTTVLHVFPGGADYFKQNGNPFGAQTGMVVNVKLFAPKGRTMQSVINPQVLTAVDDKGRSVVAAADEADEEEFTAESFSRDSKAAASVPIELHLQLPQPDAQAIDQLSAEAVAVTVGAWKEMTLTNLQADTNVEVDLAAVLPGAKLVISKFTVKEHQFSMELRLKGPRTVQGLDVQARLPGNEEFNSNTNERNSTTKGGVTTRSLMLNGFIMSEGNSPAIQGSLVLTIRSPQDMRRERVKFNLKGLDLL